ncbi:hypothetical protein PInf_016669 [Phytophthora infestans]|nr:hypothetical protein PInf_016669 [Phytophthora infestans]
MTPPLRRNQQTVDCEDTAKDPPPILAKYLQYVFLTFTDRRGDRLYALEFLAAMVVISRAIWDFSEKVELLLELFHDPATSNRKVMAHGSAQRLKETDVARMLLCVMNGVGRATQGVATVWQTHQLRVAVFARQSALRCMQSIASKRSAADSARAGTRSVSSEEYRAYVTCTPALHQFLSLFSGEELRNPLTFERRAAHWSRQTELYESLLGRYVTFEGREERRRSSAALLIQSTWRRRCSLIVAQRYADNRAAHRHESAAKLQRFFTHRRVARELEARAEIERSALNGGVFVAGSGPSIGMATTEAKKGSNTGAPVRLIGAFATPRQLHIRLAAPVTEVACGLRHALVLTQDGVVHSWGFNDHGQLGHGSAETVAARTSGRVRYASYYDQRSGEEEEYLASPTKLLYFEGCAAQQADPIPVAHVCCGDYYCMALSRAGDVFTWGEASEGQLGHGETHEYYQVAQADRHMVNSAYTYLAQPEPVLALSDVLFEWGNWGRRRGVDSEHAFVPEETVGASALRLRQVAVGDHHMLAEGASVWLKLATRTNGPIEDAEEETDFLVEPLAGASSSLEAIEKDFMGKESTSWVCCLVDLDEDDVDEDTKLEGGDDSASSASTKESNKGALWHKRAERFAVSLEGLAAPTLKFRLPHNTGQVASNGDTRSEDAKADDPSSKSAASGVVLELAVCGSNTAKRAVGRRGFTTHVYHPTMEAAAKRLKQQQLRARSMTKKKPTVTPTETNSIFVLEINQSLLTPLASAVAEGIGTESEAELEAETIISEIGHRVLELQEAGALAVLVVLDLFDADAFTLRFSDDSGVFVPVFMVTQQTQATVIGSYGDAGSVSEPDDGDSTRHTADTSLVVLWGYIDTQGINQL